MTLKEYLIQEKKKIYEFAKEIGVSQPTCSLWLLGIRTPNSTNMSKIIEITKGKVQPNDFYK